MSWEFKVGQKVVCVEDRKDLFKSPAISYAGGMDGLRRGEIYTIRALDISRIEGIAVIFINEIIRPPLRPGQPEEGYAAARFRPLVTDTQSWLKEILESPPKEKTNGPHVRA